MITRYQQSGKIITYKNPELRKAEEIKPHKRGKWVYYSEHKGILNERDDIAETAIDRIIDILMQDDAQAYKEAERFLERVGCTFDHTKNKWCKPAEWR